ncbi:hypothetical protein K523DRAFT_323804 [Schizophyllum commune Tattone D]|nr:hypothetical protein K523DRAFT_323804 [Schizophyllum commune Tattone D]
MRRSISICFSFSFVESSEWHSYKNPNRQRRALVGRQSKSESDFPGACRAYKSALPIFHPRPRTVEKVDIGPTVTSHSQFSAICEVIPCSVVQSTPEQSIARTKEYCRNGRP